MAKKLSMFGNSNARLFRSALHILSPPGMGWKRSCWQGGGLAAAADAGATEIVFDPFIRHPMLPRARVLALRDALAARGVALRLRTPSVVRPEDRRAQIGRAHV